MANIKRINGRLMQSLFQNRRMKGWYEVDQAIYAAAYEKFGGSVLTHPVSLNAIAAMVGLPMQFFAFGEGADLQAVIPVWKKWLAGSKRGLKQMSRQGIVDFGNAELILPIAATSPIKLPVQVDNLSALHMANISNLKSSTMDICLAKAPSEFSKKFRYNRKRELRLLHEQGGIIRTVDSMSNAELAGAYTRLFELRWGFKPKGYQQLEQLLGYLRPLLFGSVIEMEDKAIAIQLIYKVECPSHISMEYINGGVDPAYKSLSSGSVLTYINTQQAWELSKAQGKTLRYSFGKADNEYKDRWCCRSAVYSV